MRYQPKHRAESLSAARPGSTRLAASGLAAAALVAAPLAVAGPAEAATDRTWNRLAQCESSGNWHINTGNGYYGGLQFSASTWRGFGGGQYASYAHQASRSQQIAIAERVLNVQGWGAWPSCSSQLGLGSAEASGTPGRATRPSRGGDRPQVSNPGHQHANPGRQHTSNQGRQHTYVIKAGDTLSKIADRKNVSGGWRHLFQLNENRLNHNPHQLKIGNFLRLYVWR